MECGRERFQSANVRDIQQFLDTQTRTATSLQIERLTPRLQILNIDNYEYNGNCPTAIPCPKLSPPEYGSVDVKGHSHGSRAVYSCDHGYKLYGDSYITCDYGVWKGKIPICKRKKFSAVLDTQTWTQAYKYKGLHLDHIQYRTLYHKRKLTFDNYENDTIPTAIPCPKLTPPEYGSVDVKGHSHGSRAIYSCDHGYKLYGDSYITCDYGVWKGKIPICKRKRFSAVLDTRIQAYKYNLNLDYIQYSWTLYLKKD